MDARAHWDSIYQRKRPHEVSWYRAHLDISLRLINDAAPQRGATIIDVGGGESTLVDDLLAQGYRNVSVLDLSATALQVARERLGASSVAQWLHGDVRIFEFQPRVYDVWHDRAVFHFLTEPQDRVAYVQQVAHAVKTGGYVIVATFGPDGPEKCSGLDVVRYDSASLHRQFGNDFRLVKHQTELHRTPTGAVQQFTYCYCKVVSG
jgi:2-polyprenyl-3-methyl-5-hydroxy-6-metoxy-1,4-benzoquinol methylase